MAGELFGAPNGFLAGTQERDQESQTMLRLGQLAEIGPNIAHTQSLTQLNQAQIRAMDATRKREDGMLQALASADPQAVDVDENGKPLTQADLLEQRATKLIKAGYIEEGRKVANTADEMHSRDERARAVAAAAKQHIEDKKLKAHEDLYNFLAASTDEASFRQAKMAYMGLHPDEPIPPELQQYNPQLIALLKHTTKAGLEEIKADRDRAHQAQQEKLRLEHEDRADRRQQAGFAQQAAMLAAREAARERKEKVEGKTPAVGKPDNEMIQRAGVMLKDFGHANLDADFTAGTGKNAKELPSAAYDVAAKAKEIMANSASGLSMNEAIGQAITALEGTGAFQKKEVDVPKWFGFSSEKKTVETYDSKKAAKRTPIPYTPGVTIPRKGVPYSAMGKTWAWTGKGMVEVKGE